MATARNDITGDDIASKPSKAFSENLAKVDFNVKLVTGADKQPIEKQCSQSNKKTFVYPT